MTTTRAVTATFDLVPPGSFDVSISPNSADGIVEIEVVVPADARGLSTAHAAVRHAEAKQVDALYPEGTGLIVVATANPGFTFGGWTGNLGGIENPLQIVVDASINAGADFVPIRLRLPYVAGNFE
jgi:hypothetical protein